ncbi:NAD(P)/FAD-dependent oxidoreductase [Aquincola sp. J276]|uniref:NAD(P)/FAD-dependent oxidoreductase n=1 Tax=Aquincola sp. J276 TaxID=2898432 RepID=UPI002150B04B|nr:NAD(P)/FAD-dependent oxidoreductase [Aquincola sp. J276]
MADDAGMKDDIEQVQAVVIGAGVVGLAVARTLARAGHEVVVLEALDAIGTVTSARNSEVIHAGLYYPPGSLKARWCVEGREQLYAYCAERGIAHRRCGKLVVATQPGQQAYLHKLLQQAQANGVHDALLIDGDAARRLEPALQATAALHSPSTGIVDSHGFMLALQGEAEDHGAMLAFESPVRGGRVVPQGIELDVGGAQPMRLRARIVVNGAGLAAPAVAARIEGLPQALVPAAHYCKGSYFSLAGKAPFSRLIYPVPEAAGLGVHLTLDLGGQARFGPDTEWLSDDAPIDYRVDPRRADGFYAEIRRYWPALPDGALQPAYSGVRPKIQADGEPARDFELQGPAQHGVPGLVNLFGIESPGLTSALAIGQAVHRALAD